MKRLTPKTHCKRGHEFTPENDPKLLIRLAEYVLEHREKEAICELQSGS